MLSLPCSLAMSVTCHTHDCLCPTCWASTYDCEVINTKGVHRLEAAGPRTYVCPLPASGSGVQLPVAPPIRVEEEAAACASVLGRPNFPSNLLLHPPIPIITLITAFTHTYTLASESLPRIEVLALCPAKLLISMSC
jgi:hypothetical protein